MYTFAIVLQPTPGVPLEALSAAVHHRLDGAQVGLPILVVLCWAAATLSRSAMQQDQVRRSSRCQMTSASRKERGTLHVATAGPLKTIAKPPLSSSQTKAAA